MKLLLAIMLSAGLGGPDFLFRNVGVEQGLSSNTVSSICQDPQGNIWLATKGGVNRYNGYDVDAFRFSADDQNTVQSNNINDIFTGWDGSVWACTSDGLARYDACKGFFRRIPLGHIHSVESMIQVSETAYLLCTRNDSYIYDSRRDTVIRAEIGGRRFAFFGAACDRGTVLLGTGGRTLEFLSYTDSAGFSRRRPPVRFEAVINGILPSGGGSCWLATRGLGLCRYDSSQDRIVRVPLRSLLNETVETIAFDSDSLLWIGTKHGLCVYDWRSGRDTMLTSDPYEVASISSNAIRTAFRDSEGNMWIGSTYGGVDVMCSRKNPFRTIRRRPDKNSLSDNIVRSLYADSDSTLWVGTRYFGLNRFDLRTGNVVKICSHEHILSIFSPDWNPGVLYFGTYSNGIAVVDKRTGRMLREYESKDVNAMVAANGKKIWVGGLSGLFLFDPACGSMKKMDMVPGKSKIRIVSLMTDESGRLWVGAKEHLLCFEVSEDNVLTDVTPPALADVVRTQSLLQTGEGDFVIGTTDGLFSYSGGVLERAPVQSGLRNLTINGMVEDRSGEIWIVTGRGLCRYHPGWKTGRFYYADDGLQGDEFSQSGICADRNGNIFVGGFNGISYFNPDEICIAPAPPAPVISKLRVHNAQVKPDDGSDILSEDISLTGSIVLKHSQNSISLSFSCPDYLSAGHNHFQYRLDDFDREWIDASNREAVYTNLPKGRYVFRVRVANRDGVWSSGEACLHIRVKPVWYRSTFAEILFFLLLAGGLAWLVLKILRHNEKLHRARMVSLQERYEDDMRRLRLSSYLSSPIELTPESETFLSEVVRHIDENVSDSLFSVETLASQMCMSRSNLHLKVKAVTGAGPLVLIKRIRMDKAKSLLKQGDVKFTDVAEQCGFSSLSYFSTAFKKATGYSPGEYSALMKG